MERWGIIGGTFDPIHLAHIYIAEEAKKQLDLQKIIFMPAGSPPHKTNKRITKASLRLNMIKSAIEGKEGFEVSDYEIKEKGMSYTYKTLKAFYKENREIYFITGADCLMNLEKWREVDTILKLCNFVVFTRPGYDNKNLLKQKKLIEDKYNTKIIFLNIEGKDISSTEIRKLILEGKDLRRYLPNKVIDIINKEKLYRGENNDDTTRSI